MMAKKVGDRKREARLDGGKERCLAKGLMKATWNKQQEQQESIHRSCFFRWFLFQKTSLLQKVDLFVLGKLKD